MGPHYWCTWRTQNALSRQRQPENASPLLFAGDQGAKLARRVLNEDALFGESGMAYQFAGFRDRLFFLLDDGWDVPYETHPDQNRHLFSSLVLDAQRFPSFAGEPWERLYQLYAKLRALGWRGLGIWVACQNHLERAEGPAATEREVHDFWAERFTWCRKADIPYMKVDWGARCADIAYRRIMTEEAHRRAPGLLIEHAYPCRPMNDVFATNRFAPWQPAHDAFLQTALHSDVFRTYDTAPQLTIPTTIDRCAQLLRELPRESTVLLNCEDEPYIAAGLGLCIGAMRSPIRYTGESRKDPFHTASRILELRRALEWFTLAAPFAKAGGPGFAQSEATLSDEWHYRDGDFWWRDLSGKSVTQTAPAVCARNMALPKITPAGSGQPYVVSCKYPNGMTAISFLPRMSGARALMPLCDAVLPAEHTLGIFGSFRRLTVVAPIPKRCRVIFRDLADAQEHDITREVTFSGGAYTLLGETVRAHSIAQAKDESDPGCVIRIEPIAP